MIVQGPVPRLGPRQPAAVRDVFGSFCTARAARHIEAARGAPHRQRRVGYAEFASPSAGTVSARARALLMTSTTEIIVIDSSRAAAWALGGYRPRHERAHLFCRSPDEEAPAFGSRVLKRLSSIRHGAEVLGLTLVLGADPTFSPHVPELNHELASSVSPTGFITLLGIGGCQRELVEYFESLRMLVHPTVMLGMSFRGL
jgi:hypothetical protein